LATQLVKPASAAPDQPMILICHGQGETIDLWTPAQDFLAGRGFSSLVFDYAGFGESSPVKRLALLSRDTAGILAQIDRLLPGHPPLILVGFSLGAAALLEAGRQLKPAVPLPQALILCEPFLSVRSLMVSMNMMPKALAGLVPDLFNNGKHIRHSVPDLHIVHSQNDEVVPLAQGQTLSHQARAERCRLHVVEGFSHNAIWREPAGGYWDYLIEHLISP
jgi:alpha-beta hydrolase superfamily lysophospholipase